jgi:cardiolipin synthase C
MKMNNVSKLAMLSSRLSPIAILWILLLLPVLYACSTLPKPDAKTLSYAFDPSGDGKLATVTDEVLRGRAPDESGFLPLIRNDDALQWRLAMVDLAEETLDLQTYLWYGDAGGVLLLDRVVKAADRGVRVRILIDDFLAGGDRAIVALSQHPRIEIRLFNPWVGRGSFAMLRGIEFLAHIKRLNHRMHNKLIVADNRFSIVGGRNIGNEYFGLNKKQNFVDLDVLSVGPVSKEVSVSFDLFWNSQWAYPGESLSKNYQGRELLPQLRDWLRTQLEHSETLLSAFPMHPQTWDNLISTLKQDVAHGEAHVVYDEPLVGEDLPPVQLIESIDALPIETEKELLIVSPYFIPDEEFYNTVSNLRSKGVRVVVLTNSLGANNHAIVHSAYKKHRKRVIESGIELFEMRWDADAKTTYDTPPVVSKAFGLHAKIVVVDRSYAFVGSLNLDPRSIYLNTELGMVIDSPDLVHGIARLIDSAVLPQNSWRVLLGEGGRLEWHTADQVRHRDPARNFWQRFQSGFFGFFHLDDQL